MRIRHVYSWVGHRLRECGVYLQYLAGRGKEPVILFSVSDSVSGFSSELRGSLVARHWRKIGANALVLPAQLELKQRTRIAKLLKPDIVIHQTFRHEGSNPEIFPHATNIVDLDDADFLDGRIEPRMRHRVSLCHGGIGGSRFTENWLKEHVQPTTVVWTGTPISKRKFKPPSTRSGSRVVWATTSPLANSQDADLIRDVVATVSGLAGFELLVIGKCPEQELRSFFSPVLEDPDQLVCMPYMPYHKLLDSLEGCKVGLAPLVLEPGSFNQGKSFGKILAYISAGVPVVTSDSADHSRFFSNGQNGFCSNCIEDWTDAISTLLMNSKLGDEIAKSAYNSLTERLSLEKASLLELDFVMKVHRSRLSCDVSRS